MTPSPSSAPVSLPAERRAAPITAILAAMILAVPAPAARADQQRDAGLRNVIEHAIAQAECFPDRYESAVWFTMMEPRLVKRVPDKAERLEILRTVFCEAHRKGEMRLPPGLVMAVIDIESRFNRWAVSYAGAVGLMQIMPFWPEKLGMQRHQLTQIGPNVRMGCAILRYYIKYESNNVQKALARYNGSVGRRDYSDLVIGSWSRWNGADDLGLAAAAAAQPVPKPSGR
ncbi:MAG: lytic transglycosylase domain-containing protein [Steroidobacteraceae bacterium]